MKFAGNLPLDERKLAHPGFWMAVVLTLLVIVIQVVMSIPLAVVDGVVEHVLHQPPPQLAQKPLMVGWINLVAFSGAVALGLYLNRLGPQRAFPLGGVSMGRLVGMAVGLLGAGILLSEVDNLFRGILPPPPWLLELLHDLFFPEGQLLSQVVLLVVVAPVTEELLFRGIILRGLLSRHRPAVAVAISAVLFAAGHLNPWQFLSAFSLGLLLGWMYLRTGSVVLCIIGHAINNGLAVAVTKMSFDIPGFTGTPDYSRVEFQPWWLNLAGVVLLAGGLGLFRLATTDRLAEGAGSAAKQA